MFRFCNLIFLLRIVNLDDKRFFWKVRISACAKIQTFSVQISDGLDFECLGPAKTFKMPSDFGHSPKLDWFDNRTIIFCPKSELFGFRTSTVIGKSAQKLLPKFIIIFDCFFKIREN